MIKLKPFSILVILCIILCLTTACSSNNVPEASGPDDSFVYGTWTSVGVMVNEGDLEPTNAISITINEDGTFKLNTSEETFTWVKASSFSGQYGDEALWEAGAYYNAVTNVGRIVICRLDGEIIMMYGIASGDESVVLFLSK